MRQKLIKVGAISKTPKKHVDDNNHLEGDTDEDQDDLRWLENTNEVNLVLDAWNSTTTKIINMIKGSKEIHNYMDDLPALKSSDGFRLLEIDFNNMYPEVVLELYGCWPVLSSFIISKLPPKEVKIIEECSTQDGRKVKTIRALATLLPIKPIISKKKRQWRPSRLEAKDGLVQFVKAAAEIQLQYLKKKEKFLELGISVGPQLFAVSSDEDTISECYMLINNVTYNLGSPLKAFDIYFKSFHALHSCYPRECEREFYFLQKAIYKIECDTDKQQSRDNKTAALINDFINHKTTC